MDYHGGSTYQVEGQDFFLGFATADENNCLIDSIRQVLGDQAGLRCIVNMAHIRTLLRGRHPGGATQVRQPPVANFLDLVDHGADIVELCAANNELGRVQVNPAEFRFIVVNVTDTDALHVEQEGTGRRRLYLFNEGNRHFRPLLRRRRH